MASLRGPWSWAGIRPGTVVIPLQGRVCLGASGFRALGALLQLASEQNGVPAVVAPTRASGKTKRTPLGRWSPSLGLRFLPFSGESCSLTRELI